MTRRVELDALRGLAALVVAVFHLKYVHKHPWMGSAVDLFFVLSGYLITSILLNLRFSAGTLKAFYARRAIRILPIYYLALGVVLAIHPLMSRLGAKPLDALPYFLTYTQNASLYWHQAPPAFPGYFLHAWTLSIEEQFYLAWPFLALALGRRWLWWAIPPILGMAVWARLHFPRGDLTLLGHCDVLALGGLLALLLDDRGGSRSLSGRARVGLGAGMGLAGALGLAWWVWGPSALERWGPSWWDADRRKLWTEALEFSARGWTYFGLVGLVALDAGRGSGWLAPLRWRWLTGLGMISYGLYLYHPIVFALISAFHNRVLGIGGSDVINAIKLGAAIGAAWLSWRWIEEPLLRRKDRFPYPVSDSVSGADSVSDSGAGSGGSGRVRRRDSGSGAGGAVPGPRLVPGSGSVAGDGRGQDRVSIPGSGAGEGSSGSR